MKFKFKYHDKRYINGASLEVSVSELMNIKLGLNMLVNDENTHHLDKKIAQNMLDVFKSEKYYGND